MAELEDAISNLESVIAKVYNEEERLTYMNKSVIIANLETALRILRLSKEEEDA